jgi:hypothetical protein
LLAISFGMDQTLIDFLSHAAVDAATVLLAILLLVIQKRPQCRRSV